MTPPGPDSQPPGTASDDQSAGARASLRAAIAAFEAIGSFARAEARPWDATTAVPRDPAPDSARLERTLCALRHLADQFGALSFGDVLSAADEQYRLRAGTGQPATARALLAGQAIGACERAMTAPARYRGGFWPPDTLSYLHDYGSRHGLYFEAAVGRLTTRLIAALRHYADHQGTSFQDALATGLQAHARQRLDAEGPFQAGQDPRPQPATQFPLPAKASLEPAATNQGVVTSAADAAWLLIRTAARNQDREQQGQAASPRDADDQRVLAEALAQARGLSFGEILSELAPQVAARVAQIGHGPAAAAGLGREHGRAAVPPYCDLEIDGDATALLHALGETEWMTDGNHPYRVSLVIAYASAYKQAAGHRLPLADSPARIAARDFPHENPVTHAGTPGTPGSGRQAPAAPQASPRHGPRQGT